MAATIAITLVHEDVQNLIYDTVWKFKRRWGGDYEELLSTANEVFMRAYNTYEPSKGKFSSWLVQLLNWILLEKCVRRPAMRHARVKMYNGVEDWSRVGESVMSYTPSKFKLVDFMDELSDDAKTIVEMVLDTPNDLKLALMTCGKNPNQEKVQGAFAEVLEDLGWTPKRIRRSFKEVAEALLA